MNNYKTTPEEFLKSIQIIHMALITGVVLFALIAVYIHFSGFEFDGGKELNSGLIIVVPVFAIAGIIASRLVFKFKLKECITKQNMEEKITDYRSALIIKFALIEGCAMFSVIAFLLTNNLLYLGITGLLLVVFIIYRPTAETLSADIEVTQKGDDKNRYTLN